MANENPDGPPDWDGAAAMKSLAEERDVFDDTPESQARKILEDGVATAAASLVHIAAHGEKETARIAASKEVLTRVFGPDRIGGAATDPFEQLVGMIVKDAEEAANAPTAQTSSNTNKNNDGDDPLGKFKPEGWK